MTSSVVCVCVHVGRMSCWAVRKFPDVDRLCVRLCVCVGRQSGRETLCLSLCVCVCLCVCVGVPTWACLRIAEVCVGVCARACFCVCVRVGRKSYHGPCAPWRIYVCVGVSVCARATGARKPRLFLVPICLPKYIPSASVFACAREESSEWCGSSLGCTPRALPRLVYLSCPVVKEGVMGLCARLHNSRAAAGQLYPSCPVATQRRGREGCGCALGCMPCGSPWLLYACLALSLFS
mmetsp:Transcript_46607/g.113494  ORF Transcript_46607/g.113494 Transcript_46607/m.113494 type:complete len:236 (+) Transcript_46607:28-735(+)